MQKIHEYNSDALQSLTTRLRRRALDKIQNNLFTKETFMRKQMLYISSAVLFTSILLGGCNNLKPDAYSYSYEQRSITLTTEPSDAQVTLVQPFGQPSVSLGRTPLDSYPVPVMMRLKSENLRVTAYEYAMHLGTQSFE